MKAIFSKLFLTLISYFLPMTFGSSLLAAEKNKIQFDSLIEKVQVIYAPVVASSGGSLVVNSFWDSNVLNAFADRRGSQWIVEIYGGIYRHEKVTADGLTALLCHELGHHLGSAPFKADIAWMSSEGQADFFSASTCLRQVWANEDNLTAIQSLDVPIFLKEQCSQAYASETGSALCIRIAMAGFSFVEFNRVEHGYSSENTSVKFETPATSLVGRALTYPRAQCRLDTFLAGALQQNRPLCWYLPTPK